MIEPAGGPGGAIGLAHVSTGELPPPDLVQALVTEAHGRYRIHQGGKVSRVYPALGAVPADLFGVCVVGASGRVYAAGDAEVEFSLMSVAKPFVFALVCDAVGPDDVRGKVGVNATGRQFNSLAAIEQHSHGRTNPMVNPGAIATTSLAPGGDADAKWAFIHEGLSRFAGRELALDEEIYASASTTNHRNQAIARLLEDYDRLFSDPADALDLYTRQSSLRVTAKDLAVMGATLADVGLPGKSGIGGGIVTVSPGKGGLGTFAPPLDEAGNSVKGQLVARFLSRRLGLDLFLSAPQRSTG